MSARAGKTGLKTRLDTERALGTSCRRSIQHDRGQTVAHRIRCVRSGPIPRPGARWMKVPSGGAAARISSFSGPARTAGRGERMAGTPGSGHVRACPLTALAAPGDERDQHRGPRSKDAHVRGLDHTARRGRHSSRECPGRANFLSAQGTMRFIWKGALATIPVRIADQRKFFRSAARTIDRTAAIS